MYYQKLIKPLLFHLDPEKAHDSTIIFAKLANENPLLRSLAHALYFYQPDLISQDFGNVTFPSPVGLAPGFDKNGVIAPVFYDLGFGFVEVGSITAQPSEGNPKPRAFRLPADHALINRMGLNNEGVEAIIKRLSKSVMMIPLGVNIAKTHNPVLLGDAAIQDYVFSYGKCQRVADYITLNISCPNTTEGKTFEQKDALNELLTEISKLRPPASPPTLVKFSVDLNKKELQELVEICENHSIDGYVATNTSSKREHLKTNRAQLQVIGKGGLSGRPIHKKSTQIIHWIYEITQGSKVIIGVGGIDSFESALDKIKAGADLIQVYTGLLYEGPGLVKQINRGFDQLMKKHGLTEFSQIRDLFE